ncbi:MAG: aspartate kinase, partial [Thermoplasmata archaeon]|nr:aspartate kinase [Thermoplasmata archaeon]
MAVVMKFGGVALRDGDGMRRAAAIVAQAGGGRVVVASAMAGVTDRLRAALADARRDPATVQGTLDALRHQHLAALGDAAGAAETDALAALLERLARLLHGVALTQEVTPRLRDLAQSFGERLAVTTLAAVLRATGTPAAAFDAEAARVLTLGPFGNANPDLAGLRRECAPRLRAALAAGQVPVVTGYYGIDADGNPTLFGRGGSDFVAALVAHALRAEALELWKDVPGFLTADPRAVAGACLVAELRYDEAAELANYGARILHPRTVEPLEADRIPLRIRPLADPAAPGTLIRAEPTPAAHPARSVATLPDVAIVRLGGAGMASTPGMGERILAPLAAAGINVINLAAGGASFALLLDGADASRAQAALAPLVGGPLHAMDARSDRTLVCVVGRGLGQAPGAAAAILGAVGDAGVNVEMISLGASDIAIDFV